MLTQRYGVFNICRVVCLVKVHDKYLRRTNSLPHFFILRILKTTRYILKHSLYQQVYDCCNNLPVSDFRSFIFFCREKQHCIFFGLQVEFHTTESVVTVDWENGFVEASAKDNVNVSQIFKELLVQAKVKYNLSPALRRRRRQSLPTGPQGAPGSSPTPPANQPHVPSPAQLAHLQQIRERHSSKRNSCVIS